MRVRKNCNGSGAESTWDEREIEAKRLSLLKEDPATAPNGRGVLVIDETGDRKDGHQTAHVGRQYLGKLGKIDNGVVSESHLWADERVYYPVDVEPYTPASHFAKGKNDSQFRTKLQIAMQLVERALKERFLFRAVVADSFYGEDRSLRGGLRKLKVPYVLALKPEHGWWHPEGRLMSNLSGSLCNNGMDRKRCIFSIGLWGHVAINPAFILMRLPPRLDMSHGPIVHKARQEAVPS